MTNKFKVAHRRLMILVTASILAACSGAAVTLAPSKDGGGDVAVDAPQPATSDASANGDVASDAPAPDAAVPLDDAGCPTGRGPQMARVPGLEGGTYCIDRTEVTNAEYAAFVAAGGQLLAQQPSQCAANTSFAPLVPGTEYTAAFCGYDPAGRANYPVACVNWCDARAFCQWAGKALCTAANGPWPPNDQWANACSSAGKYVAMYGSAPVPGQCVDNTYDGSMPVGSLAGCQPKDPRFAGVFDLLGNVDEWTANCDSAQSHCYWVGGAFILPAITDCRALIPPGATEPVPVTSRFTDLGFRCCTSF